MVSGFIAYFGDILGRRMGKKRLTLFGLRPRHTAIVMTTITGMVISGLALITLISINPSFQRMFREGDQIIERNQTLTSTNAALEKKGREMVARSKALEKEVEKQQRELKKAKADVEKAFAERNAAIKARDAAAKSIARLEQDISSRKTELAALRQRNNVAEQDLKKRTLELASVQNDLTTQRTKLQSAQADLQKAIYKLTVASANLANTEAQLTVAENNLKAQEEKIKIQEQSIREQYEWIKREGKTNIEYQKQFLRLASQFRSGDLILRQGEELARGTVSSSKSSFGILSDLTALLTEASDKAEQLGAIPGSNNRSVALVYRQTIDLDRVLVTDDESECLKMARDAILQSYSEALVQVVCMRNTIKGEQVPVEFRLYRNNQVFRDGRLIATAKFDGALSEGRILLSVIDFLHKDVSEAALRAGIVPIANSDSRLDSGKDPTGQVEGLMALVDRIKAENGPVKLEAYATRDIYAAGPLNMDNMRFRITKAE